MTSLGSASETDRRALLRAYRLHGDLAARDRLIEDMIPLARSLARRYAGRGEQIDDLEQVASVGLIKAIDRFDLEPLAQHDRGRGGLEDLDAVDETAEIAP